MGLKAAFALLLPLSGGRVSRLDRPVALFGSRI